jgi:predicted acylesterase/phospholipase RssA
VPIDLALQGGGSHGAFSWGVFDRLFEEPSLRITAISGTSAGAMNAAVLALGCRARRASDVIECGVASQSSGRARDLGQRIE